MEREIGRLLGQNTRAARLFEVNVSKTDDGRAQIEWKSVKATRDSIHKSDLKIRPIWHQKEDRVAAHIFVCFLAYVLWKTLAQMCAKAGLGTNPAGFSLN